ncbi:Structure-specific endonuclease subunit slx1 [Hypsibius exemplaris]|uniref:Structure-specific endonuclease subunit SLX1 homolog n=1 Tax=Hypsibius exemplaris TaxID=2072580 RepID=A0A1W0X102_HYPEX|nr:Structure-specific endonuclease subunit slx1 [Hypsibius exemplaris]
MALLEMSEQYFENLKNRNVEERVEIELLRFSVPCIMTEEEPAITEQTVENFHGCYLLRSNSENKYYRGRTYIGYTVDPNRRQKQHNRGRKFGGACRTNNRGPWQVVVIVYGFMTNIAALQFEWAWQHPDESRRLRHSTKKTKKENALAYRLRVMAEMLSVDPWRRQALTVQWLSVEFQIDFPTNLQPPSHMTVLSGAVKTRKVTAPVTPAGKDTGRAVKTFPESTADVAIVAEDIVLSCGVCKASVEKSEQVTCLVSSCSTRFHLICLAKIFSLDDELLLPLRGSCPTCKTPVLWADLVRFRNGHYRDGIVEIQGAQALAEDVPEDAGAD